MPAKVRRFILRFWPRAAPSTLPPLAKAAAQLAGKRLCGRGQCHQPAHHCPAGRRNWGMLGRHRNQRAGRHCSSSPVSAPFERNSPGPAVARTSMAWPWQMNCGTSDPGRRLPLLLLSSVRLRGDDHRPAAGWNRRIRVINQFARHSCSTTLCRAMSIQLQREKRAPVPPPSIRPGPASAHAVVARR